MPAILRTRGLNWNYGKIVLVTFVYGVRANVAGIEEQSDQDA